MANKKMNKQDRKKAAVRIICLVTASIMVLATVIGALVGQFG